VLERNARARIPARFADHFARFDARSRRFICWNFGEMGLGVKHHPAMVLLVLPAGRGRSFEHPGGERNRRGGSVVR